MGILLEDGSRVAVIGGGPAGSLCAYFLLTFAERMDLDLAVDIYEPRDFAKPGPVGCNMCGGIVSESLLQALALEGIDLPPTVVRRGIDSYILHTDKTTLRIDTPLREKRIAAVHRGGGPRDAVDLAGGGLDGHLLGLAKGKGANVIPVRVAEVGWDEGRPQVRAKGEARTYDLLVGAVGVNSPGWQLFEQLGLKCERPKTVKTFITEIKLGSNTITQRFGSSMHMFLLNLPRLEFGAIIPKGDFITVCLLGDDIDSELVDSFLSSPQVCQCLPEGWTPGPGACHCSPRINVGRAATPYLDRLVLVGDCGVSRLYKDGIGAAYRTAKSAALTAIFSGVSAEEFAKHYGPTYNGIAGDNGYGSFIFTVVHSIKRVGLLINGMLAMASREQADAGSAKQMSMVLWDMFTGSAPYKDVFLRTLDPRFIAMFAWQTVLAAVGRGHKQKGEVTYGPRHAG